MRVGQWLNHGRNGHSEWMSVRINADQNQNKNCANSVNWYQPGWGWGLRSRFLSLIPLSRPPKRRSHTDQTPWSEPEKPLMLRAANSVEWRPVIKINFSYRKISKVTFCMYPCKKSKLLPITWTPKSENIWLLMPVSLWSLWNMFYIKIEAFRK